MEQNLIIPLSTRYGFHTEHCKSFVDFMECDVVFTLFEVTESV